MDLIIASDVSICSTMAFPSLRNSYYVVVLVSIDFLPHSKEDAPFHCTAYDYFHADWDDLHNHLRDVLLEHIFNLGASAAASEFQLQVEIDVHIPYGKYQVKPHSSSWFSAACAVAIAL